MALCAPDQQLPPELGRMQGAQRAGRLGLSRGALHRQLRLGLDALCTPSRCDLQAMGGIQLLDERELHCLPLGYQQAGWSPALGPVEDRGNKYPPAKAEVLRLLVPQRGLTAIVKSKPKTEKATNGRLPELSNFGSPPAEPGVYLD